MYRKFKGGSTETIQGLKVNIPPVGYVWNPITQELEHRGVLSRSNVKKEQYWERMSLPEDWSDLRKEEERRQKLDPEYYDPVLESVRRQAWDRRLCGCWFKNNGKPVYVSPLHCFYLDWIYIAAEGNGGYPSFYDSDRKFFYFLEYCINDPRCLGCIATTKRRSGKCFKINTLIRMFDGSVKKVQDIVDGDLVMGDDSTPRLVQGVASGREEMYEIVPRFGEPFTVNKSHILACKEWVWRGPRGKEELIERDVFVTVEEYLKLSENKKRLLRIYKNGFEANEKEHIIDPYFLGLWLGDGSSKGTEIFNEDEEVIEYVKEFAKKEGLLYHNYGPSSAKVKHLRHSLSRKRGNIVELNTGEEWVRFESKTDMMKYLGKHPKTPLKTFGLYKEGKVRIIEKEGVNHIHQELYNMSLLQNKHIPDDYIIDSRANRLKLLAGLIDTDGCLSGYEKSPAFQIAFGPKAERLKNDVKRLLDSLGFVHTEAVDKNTKAFVIRIMGDVSEIPTKIKRKQANECNRKRPSNHIKFKVNPVGVDDYYGFTVDGNNLFLLEDGTVVHNTAKSVAFLLDLPTRALEVNAGIQSKTEEDAKKTVWRDGVMRAFKKLPDFFKPTYDLSGGREPKSELRFVNTPYRGSKKQDKKPELGGTLDWRSSKDVAYDGQKLQRYVADEIFKTKDVDIRERHRVVRLCCTDDNGNFIGKILATSTVEEIEGSIEDYIKFWEDSNPENRNEVTGRTKTGLYRYFLKSDEARNRDKYGYCDTEKNRDFILAERESYKDDLTEYYSYVRKEPLTMEEAFRVSGRDSLFDSFALNHRLDELSWQDNLYDIGNFVWKDGVKDTAVVWQPTKKGRFKVRLIYESTEGVMNAKKVGASYYPNQKTKFVMGVDPFDHNVTVDNRRSDGSGYIFRKFDPSDELSYSPVMEYIHRPKMARIFYEDMLKAAAYYGSPILFENNKPGMESYFDARGYKGFLITLPGRKAPGIPGSQQTHQMLAEHLEEYILEHVNKIYFPELLKDLINFDISNTTKSDATMAFGYALIADKKMFIRSATTIEKSGGLESLFKRRRTR